ncbi:MAG: alpha/beta hydrolase [Rhodobacterales bacterium]|nr:alpha/beta hydrolase [Rhodobacterales bacterium]
MTVLYIVGAILVALMLWTQKMSRDANHTVPQVGKLHVVKGGAIHYLDMGPKDAQTLVMIHGLAGTLQHFTYALSDLLKDDYRLIIVDRPGCGYSERDSDSDAAFAVQARMIGEFLDDIGVENPVLVGHSLGGAVSLAMALDRPDKTAALALVAPLTHPVTVTATTFKGLEVASPKLRRVLGFTIAGPMTKLSTRIFLKEAFSPEPYPADFFERSGSALGLRPRGYIAASADMMVEREVSPSQNSRYADELRTPGGVLYGSGDALLPAGEQGRVMSEFGLFYEELEGRGHMLPFTAAAETADFIRRVAKMGAKDPVKNG